MTYIAIPFNLDPEQLIEDIYADFELAWPGWEPSPGNFETWAARAYVYRLILPLMENAADVPGEIFSRWGQDVINVPIHEATPATGTTTWTMVDNAGYTIPAGTQVGIATAGDTSVGFAVVEEVLVLPGSTTTGAGAVLIEAIEPGEDGNELTADPTMVDALSYVSGIVLTAPTSGGLEAEDPLAYLSRLTDELKTFSESAILARDVAIIARSVAGVQRAAALDNYLPGTDDPDNPATWDTEKACAVAVHDAAGAACSAPVKAEVDSLLQSKREVNFIFNVIDPTFTPIDVRFHVVMQTGFDQATGEANVIAAIRDFLSPAQWGQSPVGDASSWVNRRTAYYQDLVTVLNNQEGVDRYSNLEWRKGAVAYGTGDITLSGAAALPQPGVVAVGP